jgi:hypothetical protein
MLKDTSSCKPMGTCQPHYRPPWQELTVVVTTHKMRDVGVQVGGTHAAVNQARGKEGPQKRGESCANILGTGQVSTQHMGTTRNVTHLPTPTTHT